MSIEELCALPVKEIADKDCICLLYTSEECQIRFFIYPFSLRLYDTDVDSLEFINGSDRTISISCFGQEMTLAPGDSGKLVSNGKKFRHSSEQ